MSKRRPWWRPSGFMIYAVIYLTFIYLPVLFLPLFSFKEKKLSYNLRVIREC